MRSIVLVLGVGLATLGLSSTASAQYAPTNTYPTYTPVYNGGVWNTGYGAGRTWRGWNVFVGSRRNYDGGPRYVRYGNVIINRRRWGDLQNYVSYGDLIRW
jgi:hypothetical protein